MNQLRELLTNYGPIAEVWMDGAKGSNVKQEYNFEEWFALIKELQPESRFVHISSIRLVGSVTTLAILLVQEAVTF